jgi:hypothetical protein
MQLPINVHAVPHVINMGASFLTFNFIVMAVIRSMPAFLVFTRLYKRNPNSVHGVNEMVGIFKWKTRKQELNG